MLSFSRYTLSLRMIHDAFRACILSRTGECAEARGYHLVVLFILAYASALLYWVSPEDAAYNIS
jgi:hypothetical protein